MDNHISYIGVDDANLDLFESQYCVPQGMCYNSYVIHGEKIAVMDTIDPRCTDKWLQLLDADLAGRKPDYLIIQHMEPDHSGSIGAFLDRYPDTTIVASKMALAFASQFGYKPANTQVVKEGDTINLGGLTLQFVGAPMVHWPEVMMTFVPELKILFSADGFGKFGVRDSDPENWSDEARRYYFNICGKFGQQVQTVLQKTQHLGIETIAPLHGPILEGSRVTEAIEKYHIWSSYVPERKGILIAYASIHGHTAAAAHVIADKLKAKGQTVYACDLTRTDHSYAVDAAFLFDRMVLCAATYETELFPPMYNFLHKLQLKTYRNRRVALLENGTWAPKAAGFMRQMLESMLNIEIIEPVVSIKSALHPTNMEAIDALVEAIAE